MHESCPRNNIMHTDEVAPGPADSSCWQFCLFGGLCEFCMKNNITHSDIQILRQHPSQPFAQVFTSHCCTSDTPFYTPAIVIDTVELLEIEVRTVIV